LEHDETGREDLPQVDVNWRVPLLALAAIAVFFISVGLVLYFQPGSNPLGIEPDVFAAGPIASFPEGSVTYFQREHLYLVRMPGGAFLALYDLAPRTQMLIDQGALGLLACRVEFDDELNGDGLDESDFVPGFENQGFRQICEEDEEDEALWNAAGRHLEGPTNGHLDRFPVAVINNIVHIDITNRRCMNEISDTSPCIPTQ
jgi:hypothetical protein